MQTKFLFLDEGGNFDFSANGSKYLLMSAVISDRPFSWDAPLLETKYDLLENGHDREHFHAAEDKQATRDLVFNAVCSRLSTLRVHSVIVEKRKTHPSLQAVETFYPRLLGWLVTYVINGIVMSTAPSPPKIIVLTDRIPVNKKREAVEKAVKVNIAPSHLKYSILHHDSKSCLGLQVADYCNWAIYRKWDRGDLRSYNLVRPAISSEFDIYQVGSTYYY